MSIFTEEKLKEFKARLVQMEKDARKSHADLQTVIRDPKQALADAIDQAEEINERNKLLATSAYYEKNIRQIVKTLNNFEDYGFCLECGCEINEKRLEIQPATTECIHCKEVQETLDRRTA